MEVKNLHDDLNETLEKTFLFLNQDLSELRKICLKNSIMRSKGIYGIDVILKEAEECFQFIRKPI